MKLIINDRIRNRELRYFNQQTLTLKHDSFASTFGFAYNFDPDIIELKELSCIGHYHIAKLEHNDELLFTGNVLSVTFNSQETRQLVGISGYSLPGVLEDCQIPPDLYPLQSDGLSLRQIAQKLLPRFNLQMVVDSNVAKDMDAVIAISTAAESQTIKSYLTEIAKQKNIVISHTPEGKLRFTRTAANTAPAYHFEKDTPGVVSMALSFNGQAMHSHITAMKQADGGEGNAGQSDPVRNPYVIGGVYRPRIIVQSSGDDNDTQKVAEQARAAELANLKLTITLDRWVWEKKVMRPDKIITVKNPEVYLYKPTEWFIEQVDLTADEKSEKAVLTCVLPEVYNGKEPVYYFQGINLH